MEWACEQLRTAGSIDRLLKHRIEPSREDGADEMWYSVGIYAHEDEQGSLVVRVLVLNPDWDEALQIAKVTSRPGEMNCQTALGCNLDHLTG